MYFGHVTVADVTINFFNWANAFTATNDIIEYCIYDYNGTLNDNQAQQLSRNFYWFPKSNIKVTRRPYASLYHGTTVCCMSVTTLFNLHKIISYKYTEQFRIQMYETICKQTSRHYFFQI